MGAIVEIKYFNSFWCKKVETSSAGSLPPTWPSLDFAKFGYPAFPLYASTSNNARDWYIEESRIKGGFNDSAYSQGVRAYLNEKNPKQAIKKSSLIHSGVYNTTTDVNDTNVFSVGEVITSDLDPTNGSIQKLHAEQSNLIVFQENKVSKSLINKNTIYSGEQGARETVDVPVLGQNVPYVGNFGIGKNPESFAQFGFRKYFVDPIRTTVMRLSKDGLSVISDYGMKDFFRDNLQILNNNFKTNNISWTLSTNPPRPLKAGVEYGSLDLSSATLLNSGTTAALDITSVTGIGSGGKVTCTVDTVTPANTLLAVDTVGSNYAVGDIISITGDGVKFSGTIQYTLTSSDLQTITNNSRNSFYVTNINICDIILGSKVQNLSGSSISDTGAVVFKTETVGSQILITVDISIVPASTGFVSYDYKSKVVGVWDNYNRYYTVSIQSDPQFVNNNNFETVTYDENVRGWNSRYSYKPSFGVSLKGLYFTTNSNSLYQHYTGGLSNYLKFYENSFPALIQFVINSSPSVRKNYQTVNYEGDNGWQINTMYSDSTRVNSRSAGNVDSSNIILSYSQGLYTDTTTGYPLRAGFDRKENLYVASIKSNSTVREQEVLSSVYLTGIKGYYLTTTMQTDNSTDLNGFKELWSVGTTYVQSS
jgi:hypothetical protein